MQEKRGGMVNMVESRENSSGRRAEKSRSRSRRLPRRMAGSQKTRTRRTTKGTWTHLEERDQGEENKREEELNGR